MLWIYSHLFSFFFTGFNLNNWAFWENWIILTFCSVGAHFSLVLILPDDSWRGCDYFCWLIYDFLFIKNYFTLYVCCMLSFSLGCYVIMQKNPLSLSQESGNVPLIFQKKSSSSRWSLPEAHAEGDATAYSLCGETYCSKKYPSTTPHGFMMTDTTQSGAKIICLLLSVRHHNLKIWTA